MSYEAFETLVILSDLGKSNKPMRAEYRVPENVYSIEEHIFFPFSSHHRLDIFVWFVFESQWQVTNFIKPITDLVLHSFPLSLHKQFYSLFEARYIIFKKMIH